MVRNCSPETTFNKGYTILALTVLSTGLLFNLVNFVILAKLILLCKKQAYGYILIICGLCIAYDLVEIPIYVDRTRIAEKANRSEETSGSCWQEFFLWRVGMWLSSTLMGAIGWTLLALCTDRYIALHHPQCYPRISHWYVRIATTPLAICISAGLKFGYYRIYEEDKAAGHCVYKLRCTSHQRYLWGFLSGICTFAPLLFMILLSRRNVSKVKELSLMYVSLALHQESWIQGQAAMTKLSIGMVTVYCCTLGTSFLNEILYAANLHPKTFSHIYDSFKMLIIIGVQVSFLGSALESREYREAVRSCTRRQCAVIRNVLRIVVCCSTRQKTPVNSATTRSRDGTMIGMDDDGGVNEQEESPQAAASPSPNRLHPPAQEGVMRTSSRGVGYRGTGQVVYQADSFSVRRQQEAAAWREWLAEIRRKKKSSLSRRRSV